MRPVGPERGAVPGAEDGRIAVRPHLDASLDHDHVLDDPWRVSGGITADTALEVENIELYSPSCVPGEQPDGP